MGEFAPVFLTFLFQFDAVQDARCKNKKNTDCECRKDLLCESHALLIGVK
jgi:hypothetical protein